MISPKIGMTLVGLILFSGCGSLIKGAGNTILVESSPANATVYLNGNEQGTTPYNYTYDREHGKRFDLELRKSGYSSTTYSVRTKQNNLLLFVDAMLFHIPYIVDHKSTALYSLPTASINVRLFKEVPDDVEKRSVPVGNVDVSMAEGASVGTLNKSRITRSTDRERIYDDLKYGEQLSNYVVEGLRGSFMDARSVRMGTTRGDEAIRSAKIILRPKITNAEGNLIKRHGTVEGTLQLAVDWNFYNSLNKDSIVISRSTNVTYHAASVRPRDLLSEALANSARVMTEDSTLANELAAHYGTSIIATKGEAMILKAPDPIAFEGRRDMLAALVKAVVTIKTEDGHGSGFLITNDGYLLTNQHVVGDKSKVQVKFEQGFTLEGDVVKVNKDFDLALVRVTASDLPALTLGSDSTLMLGEEIFAIGTPMDTKLGQSVSRGVLSGMREIERRKYLQTDVSINPGNSGGPFLDENGHVVGIATLKISGKGLEGLGFGVPISEVLEMLNLNIIK